MVNDVFCTSENAGLMIHKCKTKVMKANASNHPDIQPEGETIETVEEFHYLGSILTPNGGAEADVRARIGKAWGVFTSMSIKKKMNVTVQRQLFNRSCCTPVKPGL